MLHTCVRNRYKAIGRKCNLKLLSDILLLWFIYFLLYNILLLVVQLVHRLNSMVTTCHNFPSLIVAHSKFAGHVELINFCHILALALCRYSLVGDQLSPPRQFIIQKTYFSSYKTPNI